MAEIKVMLADGHALVRAGIRRILEEDGEIEVIGETGDGEECMAGLGAFAGKGAWLCVLILEIRLPKMDGFQVLRKVKESLPDVRVLILTAEEKPECLIRAMDMGADGYLGKDCTPEELKTAIHTVLDNNTYIQSRWMPFLQKGERECCVRGEDSRRKWASLTAREREILAHVAEGMLNKEIASCLNISEQTVKNHLSSIFRKMDVLDRTQAAVFAMREFMGESGRGYLFDNLCPGREYRGGDTAFFGKTSHDRLHGRAPGV